MRDLGKLDRQAPPRILAFLHDCPRLRLGVTPALGKAAPAVGSAAAEFVYVNFLLVGILTNDGSGKNRPARVR